MTIVCATHLSRSSADAVQVAAELARRGQQRLVLATVCPAGQLDVTPDPTEQPLRARLEALADELTRHGGLRVDLELLHGALETALARLCTATGAQLLVAGDSRQSAHALYSTPFDRMAHAVPIPLLVVRSRHPFEAWAAGAAPLRVLLALDHSHSSTLARDWLARLAEFGPLDVVAARVWSPEVEFARHGLHTQPAEAVQLAMTRHLQTELDAALAGLPATVTRRAHLELGHGPVAPLLTALAEREQVDLVVLGVHPRGRNLLGTLASVSHAVLSDAPMSVAFVPEQGRLSADEPVDGLSLATPDGVDSTAAVR